MGSVRRFVGLVLGPCLTLRQADGCAGQVRGRERFARRSRSLRGPLG